MEAAPLCCHTASSPFFHPGCKPVHSFPASIVLSSPVRQLIGATRYLVRNSSRKTMLIAACIPTRETRVSFEIRLCCSFAKGTSRFSSPRGEKRKQFSFSLYFYLSLSLDHPLDRCRKKKDRKRKNYRTRETRVTTVPTPVFLQAKLHSPHADSLRGRQAAKFSSRFSILHSRRVNDRTRLVFRYLTGDPKRDSKQQKKRQTFLLIPIFNIFILLVYTYIYRYIYTYIYRLEALLFEHCQKRSARKKECIYRSTVKNCITE